MGQLLKTSEYFSQRVLDEIARAKRSGTEFSIAVFKSQPAEGELPEVACVRGLPAILTGVRDTDSVCRIGTDTIAVLLIDAGGEGSRRAAVRLLERMGEDAGRWSVKVLEFPERESVLVDLGIEAA